MRLLGDRKEPPPGPGQGSGNTKVFSPGGAAAIGLCLEQECPTFGRVWAPLGEEELSWAPRKMKTDEQKNKIRV